MGRPSAGPFRSFPRSTPIKISLARCVRSFRPAQGRAEPASKAGTDRDRWLDDRCAVDETEINFAGDEPEMKAAVRDKGRLEADPVFTSR